MSKQMRKRIAVFLVLCFLFSYTGFVGESPFSEKVKRAEAETISEEVEWNIKCLNAERSYEDSKKLPKIKVAVLDSGLDYDQDIPFVEREDFLEEEYVHPVYQDYTGHGTSVAGLICAKKNDDRVSGIAANVDLYVARILDANNEAPVERVIRAVNWAMEKKVNILHMSFGTREYSEELEAVIEKAYAQGILIIAAAGNDGTAAEDESTVEYPAAFDDVIAVGATNTENKKTSTSSSGAELDVVAPGDQILAMGAFNGVVVEEGTSVSAAQVTGVAAVLWGKHPSMSNEFIKNLLVGSANAESVEGDCGQGMVDYEQSDQNYTTMHGIYNEYKAMGKSEKEAIRKAGNRLFDNVKEIATHEEVNYVNGLWQGSGHASFVSESGISNINIVKAGAIAPDHEDKYMAGYSEHPCFHGGGNYIADTQYLYTVALQYLRQEKGSVVLPATFQVFGQNDPYKAVKDNKNVSKQLRKAIESGAFFKQCENEHKQNGNLVKKKITVRSNREKGYALLGAAIHNATDALSHRACIDLGQYGGWQRVIHDPSGLKKEKRAGCMATLIMNWADTKKGILADTAGAWTKLLIADKPNKLKDFYYLSNQVTKKMITLFREKDYRGYLCFLEPIENYEKGKSTFSTKLQDLTKCWKDATSNGKAFSLSQTTKTVSGGRVDARDVTIYKKGSKLYVRINNLGNKICGVFNANKMSQSFAQNDTTKEWTVPKTVKEICIVSASLSKDKIKRTQMLTSFKISVVAKGDNVSGKTRYIVIKPGNKIKLPKAIFKKNPTKKEKKQKIKYKLTGWISGGPKSQRKSFKLGATYKWTKAGTMTLYPVFTKIKK